MKQTKPVARRLLLAASFLVLAACQSAPSVPPTSPLHATDSGYVVGTADYAFTDHKPVHALIKLRRLTATAESSPQHYLLRADYDSRASHAIFAGVVPAGVYELEEAIDDDSRYTPGTLRMPFEVQAGRVTDAGHFPLSRRVNETRTSLAQ